MLHANSFGDVSFIQTHFFFFFFFSLKNFHYLWRNHCCCCHIILRLLRRTWFLQTHTHTLARFQGDENCRLWENLFSFYYSVSCWRTINYKNGVQKKTQLSLSFLVKVVISEIIHFLITKAICNKSEEMEKFIVEKMRIMTKEMTSLNFKDFFWIVFLRVWKHFLKFRLFYAIYTIFYFHINS